MAGHNEPQLVLYDLACTKGVCFSPVVWRIRLMLNYKQIPYRTIFLEFPDIEPTLKGLGIPPPAEGGKYTVPAIHHLPSDTYMMDSTPIAQFIESNYPSPPLSLTSELGTEILAEARKTGGTAFLASIMPREIRILCPRSQEFFRRTREARLGHPLEELLEGDREEQAWAAADAGMQRVGKLLQRNAKEGPFVLGARPSYADFFIVGNLQTARVIDEGVFRRNIQYPGLKELYEACQPWMQKKD